MNPSHVALDFTSGLEFVDLITADGMKVGEYCGRDLVAVGMSPSQEPSTLTSREVQITDNHVMHFSINVGCGKSWDAKLSPVSLKNQRSFALKKPLSFTIYSNILSFLIIKELLPLISLILILLILLGWSHRIPKRFSKSIKGLMSHNKPLWNKSFRLHYILSFVLTFYLKWLQYLLESNKCKHFLKKYMQ